MNGDSLVLSIASLPLRFYCKRKADSTFLKSRYADFLLQEGKSLPAKSSVFLIGGRSRKVKLDGKNFYFQVLPLKENFKLFNDLLRIALIYLLNRSNAFVLHASALVKDDSGLIFAGSEESGKSTIRKILPELVCLGDDTAIIRKIDGRFFLFGPPFYQRTERAYPNRQFPVKSVFEISQADFNLVRLLDFPENLRALSTNSYIADFGLKSRENELLLKNLSDFCLKNKVFSLFFKKDRSFWPLVEAASSRSFLAARSAKIVDQTNSQVLEKLPQGIIWSPALSSWEFLGECRVINEASWKFEFKRKRRIKDIAKLIGRLAVSSPHTERVNKKRKQMAKTPDKGWIVLLEGNDSFTIIDGNHRAIAAYQLGKEGKDSSQRLLIGKLPRGETSLWF